jgi:hypothetical protein
MRQTSGRRSRPAPGSWTRRAALRVDLGPHGIRGHLVSTSRVHIGAHGYHVAPDCRLTEQPQAARVHGPVRLARPTRETYLVRSQVRPLSFVAKEPESGRTKPTTRKGVGNEQVLMPVKGLAPPCLAASGFKPDAYSNSATPAVLLSYNRSVSNDAICVLLSRS